MKQKKCENRFVATILKLKNKSIQVSCLRHYKERKQMFVFPSTLDISDINFKQIKCKLLQPEVNKGTHSFPKSVL